ncbi:MAG: hypothetical protein KDK08_03350, partial [Rhizobiaceae bacterium]|nr:hypothetical protein [Rhizobiaceae bacterium]
MSLLIHFSPPKWPMQVATNSSCAALPGHYGAPQKSIGRRRLQKAASAKPVKAEDATPWRW